MSGSGARFSKRLTEILRNADRTLRYLVPGEHRRLYDQWRVTMGTIAPVDSFYVAFFREDDLYLVVPYMFDEEQEYGAPGFQTYGPEGLSAWIKKHAEPYSYSMDNGRLLNKGHPFGDEERLSRDAIAIPLLAPSPDASTVIGIASMQTYRAGVYTEETVRAFQWLGGRVMTVLMREREDIATQATLTADGVPAAESAVSIFDVVENFGHQLERIRTKIEEIISSSPPSEDLLHDLEMLRDLCERAQSETTEVLIGPSTDAQAILRLLTPRERQVAQLMSEGLNNERIAAQLTISELTVKTHVTRILRKFGVRQRAAVAAKLRPFG